MNQHSGLSGCQVLGIVMAVLLVAVMCGAVALTLGGVTGYAIGRSHAARTAPSIEATPLPQHPGDEGWGPPEETPEMRPYLGVRYQTVEEGARIVEVEPDSPANEAGLRQGDVILTIDGEPVGEGYPNLATRILEREPWDEVELRVQRGDEELGLEVTLGAKSTFEGRPGFPPEELPLPPEWRLPPEEWPQQRAYLGVRIRQLEKGAEVTEVTPGTPAEEAGLREGDLILAVDDEEVTLESPLVALITAHEPGDTVALTVERNNREQEIKVELGEWPAPAEPEEMWQG